MTGLSAVPVTGAESEQRLAAGALGGSERTVWRWSRGSAPGQSAPRPPPALVPQRGRPRCETILLWVPRPPTPEWLKRFVIELYGGRCLRCGIDRPLEVAHLAPWPVVRDDAMRQPGPNQEGMAILRFHQPENLVLLCANCHTLLDDPAVAEVDQGLMFYLRDRATATGHFGEVTRSFVCKEMTGNRRRPSVSDAALAPLFDWLQKAVERGALPEPHRFTVPWGNGFFEVNLASSDLEYKVAPDPALPLWNGRDFVRPSPPRSPYGH